MTDDRATIYITLNFLSGGDEGLWCAEARFHLGNAERFYIANAPTQIDALAKVLQQFTNIGATGRRWLADADGTHLAGQITPPRPRKPRRDPLVEDLNS